MKTLMDHMVVYYEMKDLWYDRPSLLLKAVYVVNSTYDGNEKLRSRQPLVDREDLKIMRVTKESLELLGEKRNVRHARNSVKKIFGDEIVAIRFKEAQFVTGKPITRYQLAEVVARQKCFENGKMSQVFYHKHEELLANTDKLTDAHFRELRLRITNVDSWRNLSINRRLGEFKNRFPDAFGEWIRWKVAVVYWHGYIQTLKGLEDANANANDPVLVKIICNVAMWKAKVRYFEGIII